SDHQGNVSSQTGLALSCAPPARGEGLAGIRVGRVGEPPQGKVLQAYEKRAAQSRNRDRQLGADCDGHLPGARSDIVKKRFEFRVSRFAFCVSGRSPVPVVRSRQSTRNSKLETE